MMKELSNDVLYKFIEQAQKPSKIFDVKYFFVLSKTGTPVKIGEKKIKTIIFISNKPQKYLTHFVLCLCVSILTQEKEHHFLQI